MPFALSILKKACVFTLKTNQTFPSTLRRKNLKSQQITAHAGFVSKEKFDKLNTDHLIVLTPSFSKKSFFKMFSFILSHPLFRFLSTVSCRRVISKSSIYVGPQGNSEFCFPSTSLFPSTSPRETMRVLWKQNSLFPLRPVIKCLIFYARWAKTEWFSPHANVRSRFRESKLKLLRRTNLRIRKSLTTCSLMRRRSFDPTNHGPTPITKWPVPYPGQWKLLTAVSAFLRSHQYGIAVG